LGLELYFFGWKEEPQQKKIVQTKLCVFLGSIKSNPTKNIITCWTKNFSPKKRLFRSLIWTLFTSDLEVFGTTKFYSQVVDT